MTTNTIRPNATVSTGGASFTGGAGNWHGNTSDDSDASYATLPAGAAALLDLGTFTLDAGNVTKQARVRARVRGDSVSSTFSVSGFSELGQTGYDFGWLSGLATTTIATFTGAWVPLSATQSAIDVVQLLVSAISGAVRVLELYIDVMEVTPPTVVLVNPTGTLTVSSGNAAHTYTQGSDGGPQTHLQMKAFTSAVIGGGGFDPETSSNIYDSGVVATSAVINHFGPIVDGTNHGFYIKVAQTINSGPHWSAWDNNTFTVDTTGPNVDAIAGVATNNSGLITVTVDRDTGGVAWDTVTVERSFDSGTTWEFVRGATETAETNEFATFAANSFVVADYEVPSGTSVVYRARASLAGEFGAWSSNSTPTSWTNAAPFLKHPGDKDLNKTVDLWQGFEVNTSDVTRFSLELFTENSTEATEIAALLGRPRRSGVLHPLGAVYPVVVTDGGTPLLLQSPSTFGVGDRWFMPLSWTKRHHDPKFSANGCRLWAIECVEVDRPPDTTSV